MKKVIVYFNRKALISSAEEGVEFINSLQYRGNSHRLVCNHHCELKLQEIFSGQDKWNTTELAASGCSTTRIYLYDALADNLEEHDRIVQERRQAAEKERAERAEIAWQEWMAEAYAPLKGWYIVTVTGTAFKLRGNDGPVTKSVKVLADTQIDAYDKAVDYLQNNFPNNVCGWYGFESARSSMIEYVGVWTDEAELEYPAK